MTIRVPTSAMLIAVLLLVGWAGAFGLAWVVTDWRGASDDDVDSIRMQLDDLTGDLDDLEEQLTDVDTRLTIVEVPGEVNDRDILELYARTDYQTCTDNAEVPVNDAKTDEDEAFRDYIGGFESYDYYEAAYERYTAAYRQVLLDLDDCWDTFLADSPFS